MDIYIYIYIYIYVYPYIYIQRDVPEQIQGIGAGEQIGTGRQKF